MKNLSALLVTALPLLFSVASHAAPTFTIATFNLAGGAPYQASYAYGLNAQGDVVGSGGGDDDGYAPFVYSGGVVTTLPGGFFDAVYGISDNGQIVGSIGFVPSRYDAVSGTWIPLTSDENATDVYDVNDAGVAVGQSFNPDTFDRQAVRYNADGSITNLGTLREDGTGASNAVRINATGNIAGSSDTENGGTHAVRFDSNGDILDLGSLAGADGYSEGHDINDLGQIVGASDNANGDFRGFIWTAGIFQELGIVEGGGFEYSEAFGINNLGHVVGRIASYDGGVNSAFYYDGATLYDLATLVQGGLAAAGIGNFFDATSINDAGQILGNAFTTDGERVGVLLTVVSVPEPATWGAGLGMMLGVVILLRRRERACV